MSDVFNIPWVIKIISKKNPKSILDVGIGNGTYGFLIRQSLDIGRERLRRSEWLIQIDGIEVFEQYRNPVWEYYYNTVRISDVTTIASDLPRYDVILLLDVIEHFSKIDGKQLLKTLVDKSDIVIVSTPNRPYPQGAVLNNIHESHLSSWSEIDFEEFFHITFKLNVCDIYVVSQQKKALAGLETYNFPRLSGNSNNLRKRLTKTIKKVKFKLGGIIKS